MEILTFDTISFGWRDMLASSMKRNSGSEPSEEMALAAERAYFEGLQLLEMRAVVEMYRKDDGDGQSVVISLADGASERLHIGSRAGYLAPAGEIAVILCTVGAKLVARMQEYAATDDYLAMYYMDVLGVRALAEVSANVHSYIEAAASEKGWGVGPSMQPGSVEGWTVEGQRDLFRLGHGEVLNLSLNESAFLIPHISDSALIGIGPDYSASKVGSMCHECPRFSECLWCRENGKE